ncbi:hypothetical protein Bhyg_05656, partial [Pseudolycoriella hygida]
MKVFVLCIAVCVSYSEAFLNKGGGVPVRQGGGNSQGYSSGGQQGWSNGGQQGWSSESQHQSGQGSSSQWNSGSAGGITSAKVNRTSSASSIPSVLSASNDKNKSSISRSSVTTTGRSPPALPDLKEILEEKIRLLESRLSDIEASLNEVVAENAELKSTVADLKSEVASVKAQTEHRQQPSESTISQEQEDINTNIVIRGTDVNDSSTAAELTAIVD